jgi:anti-sigma B factor antagonist
LTQKRAIRLRFRPAGTVRIWSRRMEGGRVPLVELKVSSRAEGDRVIVALSGEIDLYTAPRLQSQLAAALNTEHAVRLVVDMSGVDFCDSTGMNVLLGAQRLAREHGGDVELSAPRPAVRKILQVTGLESVFTVVEGSATVPGQ